MLLGQVLVNTAVLWAAYALLALGFVLVLNATGAVNFGHGDLVVAGGFGALALASWLPLPGLVLLPALLLGMAGLGVAVAILAYFPLRRRPPEAVFIGTIAVGVMVQNAAALIFGPEPRAAPLLLGGGAVDWNGVNVPVQSLAILGVSAGLIGAVAWVFRGTALGRRLRAAAQDPEAASLLGVRVDRVVAGSFAAGAALAGTAGLLLGRTFFLQPADGGFYMLKAYVAATLGGWGSLPGAVLGALLIAAFEAAYPALPALVPGLARAGALFTQEWGTAVLDMLVLVILATRPGGLLGTAVRARP